MRVCFLYKDYSYNYALHSCSKELRTLGVTLESVCVKSAGEAVACVRKCDLLIIDTEIVSDQILDTNCRKNFVALYSTIDAAHVAPVASWLSTYDVVGLIKSYIYNPIQLHNLGYYWLNMKYLADAGYKATNSHALKLNGHVSLPEEKLSKIHAFGGFGCWERQIDLLERIKPDFETKRNIPIHFAGWMDYCGSETEDHRKRAVQVCNDCGGVGIAGRNVEVWEFRRQMLESYCVLSPWGWGEACHRDFEALAVGAVLVKPDWSFVRTNPDISSIDAPYIRCKLDFSDVPDTVRDVQQNWGEYCSLRKRGYELALDAVSPMSNAKRFKTILDSLVC